VATVKVKVNVGLGAWSDGTWDKPGKNLPTIGDATDDPESPESDNTNNPPDDGSDILTPGDDIGGPSDDAFGGDTDGTMGSDTDEGLDATDVADGVGVLV
jgi:hypothetical protein